MAADYDKLFRPHEGMEAPDDMAAQPFFDPSASFPPAPASANLPKPNGQTPPPTSDDLSERFVSDPNRPHPNHPHLRCPSPDLHPPQPNPSWRPPDHRHHKRQPERRSNRNHRRPTYPRTGHINPGAPHQHRPGQRCQSANPRPLRPDRLRPRPNHRPGLPPNTPDVRAGVTAIAQTPNETSGR